MQMRSTAGSHHEPDPDAKARIEAWNDASWSATAFPLRSLLNIDTALNAVCVVWPDTTLFNEVLETLHDILLRTLDVNISDTRIKSKKAADFVKALKKVTMIIIKALPKNSSYSE
jgi:hypothetical protein